MSSPAFPSALFATRIIFADFFLSKSTKIVSLGITPERASIIKRQTSELAIAFSVKRLIRPCNDISLITSKPAVSITLNFKSANFAIPSRKSRVTPGSLSTMASFFPTNLLNNVDFPTFGLPINATESDIIFSFFYRPVFYKLMLIERD